MESSVSESASKATVIEINLLGMLRRRWPHIAFGIFVGLSLAGFYYFSTDRMYESKIEILVGQRSSEVTNNGTITGANASGDNIQEDQLATHLRLFVGRRMLAEAIQKGNLDQLASFQQVVANGGSVIDHILKNIEVNRGGEGSARDAMVLRASYRDTNPEDAAIVLSAIYDSYRDYVESHGHNSTEQAVELMEKARETHELELATADREYREFVTSVPVLIEGSTVQDVHKDRLENLEAELNIVTTSLAESRSRLEVIKSYLATRDSSKINSMDHLALLSQKEVERLKLFLDVTRGETQSEAFQAEQPIRQEVAKAQYNRMLDLIQKERGFSDAFGAGHPLVEAVRQEIEITRRFISSNQPAETKVQSRKFDAAEMLSTYTSLLSNDIAELEKRKEFLLQESTLEMRLAKEVESDFMKGSSMKSKLTRAQSRYDEVILRLQELKLSRSYAGFSTDLLESPEVSQSAAWPKLPIIAAIGLFLGMTLGLLLAVGSELMDSTFSDVADLERTVGAPAIAHVPRFNLRKLRKLLNKDSGVQPSLVCSYAPRSTESEVYRVARTALMVTNRKDDVRTIMMTSPQPGDGKSTTISNLAISFARAGKSVLLIDADMRRPVIAGLFNVAESPGLSDVLRGEISADTAIKPSEIPNLNLMANGSPTSDPAELLESARFSMMLSEMSLHFDLVLIDAPPLLAVADPAIIAPIVDSVVMTIRVSKNGRRPVEQATKILQDIGMQPSAVIVNGVDQDAKSYGYGNYQRDRYGYVGHYHNQYAATNTENLPSVRTVPSPKGELGPKGEAGLSGELGPKGRSSRSSERASL
ncbi:Tyrosine-protein kinase YwqD [Rubripirellula lacrimiformis]|uniref:non-specific protein-tyrosine kinase n=1 Tax=Rubripirellula lacrimiformis TaxID=1930273 RepID=A0A517NFU9_9BACT|nr:polysaccharide biosynthesis tyrosine autokinase [Rubripirellula lacrimiformis]QDT06016.1 Tyrosine-protein kinase YwqD [Rubripirellula lacrimiformis]